MARASHQDHFNWIAFAAGAVAALALVLGYAAWRTGEYGVQALQVGQIAPAFRPVTPDGIPNTPQIPDTPRF